jgi:hypothetical protein
MRVIVEEKFWKFQYAKNFSVSRFRNWRGQIASLHFVDKITRLVRAVTERLIGGMATTAEADCGAACQTEFIACRIDDLEITFDQNRAVVLESYFCWRHLVFLVFE